MSAIVPFINNGEVSSLDYSSLSESIKRANHNAENSLKPSSQETYNRYLKLFDAYCKEKNVAEPFKLSTNDASILCGCFISDMKEKGCYTKTLITIRAALKYAYEHHGYDPSPTGTAQIKRMMQGIEKTNRNKPPRAKERLTAEEVVKMISLCDVTTKKGLMHRAIIAMNYCGAFRRSEVAQLQVEQLTKSIEGYTAKLEDSKSGQITKGIVSGAMIPLIHFVDEWLAASEIKEGYIFHRFSKGGSIKPNIKFPHISDREICRIIQKYTDLAGIKKRVGSHSMRRGAAVDAAEAGADLLKIAELLGHTSLNSTMIYVKEGNLFVNHALRSIVDGLNK